MAERQELQVVLRTIAQGQGAQQTATSLRQVGAQAALTNQQTLRAAAGMAMMATGIGSAAAAAATLTGVLASSINAQRENERITRATAAAYGGSAQQFTRFAEALSTTTGFTSQAILQAALSARTLSANYGLTTQQTQNLIRASADLARVRGIGVAESFERVQSAIRGEAEASEYLGLTLNDTFIKNNALNGSVKNTFERMTDAQKAQIRYTELLRQTATFSGLAAKATNSLEGAFGTADVAANKLQITIGKLAAPTTIAALRGLAVAMGAVEQALPEQQGAFVPKPLPLGPTALIEAGKAALDVRARIEARALDARKQAVDAANAAELEVQREQQQRLAELQRRPAQGVWVTQAANALRGGERQMQSLREIAYLDQRDAAIRDLLFAQREEVALKEQLTQLEKQQGDLAARRAQVELASIAAQQRALPAQQALADTERAVERARLVLQIRGVSAAERGAARATIRGAERDVLPGQRLAAFDAETGVLAAGRQERAFDLSARASAIGTDKAIADMTTLAHISAARTDAAQARLADIMQKALDEGVLKRPPVNVTLQLLNAEGQVTYEELIEAADQAGMPPVIKVSGVRR